MASAFYRSRPHQFDDDDAPPRVPPRFTTAELERLITRLAEELGHSAPTRTRHLRGVPTGTRSRSRRDGFQPDAALHVERYLLREAFGLSVPALAQMYSLTRSSVYSSLAKGRQLCRQNATPATANVLRQTAAKVSQASQHH